MILNLTCIVLVTASIRLTFFNISHFFIHHRTYIHQISTTYHVLLLLLAKFWWFILLLFK